MKTEKCLICGNDFQQLRSYEKKTCSRSCATKLQHQTRECSGDKNSNWKGGEIKKNCAVCGKGYFVKHNRELSKYCSLRCVGISQKGMGKTRTKKVEKACEVCGKVSKYYPGEAHKYRCCSKKCSFERRAKRVVGENNPAWKGGMSRFPYPWNFKKISYQIRKRDLFTCRNPYCDGNDKRLTAHHINYNKEDCRPKNLITLCSTCNSRANFKRDYWMKLYSDLNQ